MGLIKKSYLKEVRARCVKEMGKDIPDKIWNKVVEDVEADIKKDLNSKKTQKALAKAFWNFFFKHAEEGNIILKIDDIDVGKKIRDIQNKEKNDS
jgi:hypothetical protein